uniref:Uncharacterized protein n=1 Tax=Rhizoctonia cerealis bunyavirus TaxID=3068840 RepID=A0AA51BTY9_9VIRU|nr:MAG: hypothetical protein [Rhizoctonia cerealis bunyavirus]
MLQMSSIKSSTEFKGKFDSRKAEAMFALYDATGVARKPEVIVAEAQEKLIQALKVAKMYIGKEKTRTTLPKNAELEEVNMKDGKAQKFFDDNILNGLVAFAMKEGNLKEQRWYFIIAVGEKGPYYSCLPEMAGEGNKGKLQTALADLISQEIVTGRNTALTSFFKSKAWTPPNETLQFMFPKGMHVSNFPKDKVQVFRKDIEIIFDGMKNQPKAKPDWVWKGKDEIKFFVKGDFKPGDQGAAKAEPSTSSAEPATTADF